MEGSLSANELKRLLHSHGLKPQDAVRIDSSAVSERRDADGETRPLMLHPAPIKVKALAVAGSRLQAIEAELLS